MHAKLNLYNYIIQVASLASATAPHSPTWAVCCLHAALLRCRCRGPSSSSH